jgi:hypothetical protein
MEMKMFRATTSIEIAKMEPAMNEWLKTLPTNIGVFRSDTAYCSLDGVPSVVVTVFWDVR